MPALESIPLGYKMSLPIVIVDSAVSFEVKFAIFNIEEGDEIVVVFLQWWPLFQIHC